jgi:hypothetical protein
MVGKKRVEAGDGYPLDAPVTELNNEEVVFGCVASPVWFCALGCNVVSVDTLVNGCSRTNVAKGS